MFQSTVCHIIRYTIKAIQALVVSIVRNQHLQWRIYVQVDGKVLVKPSAGYMNKGVLPCLNILQ